MIVVYQLCKHREYVINETTGRRIRNRYLTFGMDDLGCRLAGLCDRRHEQSTRLFTCVISMDRRLSNAHVVHEVS